jgi:hypothetical protein
MSSPARPPARRVAIYYIMIMVGAGAFLLNLLCTGRLKHELKELVGPGWNWG